MLYYAQVEAAVAAAKEAFPGWSEQSPEQRAKVLNKLADLIEAHLEEFAQAESKDQGVLINVLACCINPGVSQVQGYQSDWVSGSKYVLLNPGCFHKSPDSFFFFFF